jgi:hypothetical protein
MTSRLVEWILRVKDETGPALESAAENASDAAEGIDDLGESSKDAEKQAGKAKEVMEGFAGALDRVSPAAGAAVRAVGSLAGGVKSATAATGASLALLGPLAVALGAAAGAYLYLKQQIDKAEEAQRAANETAKKAMEIGRQVEVQKLREAAATGQITEAELARRLATFEAQDLFADWLDEEREKLRALEEERSRLVRAPAVTEESVMRAGAFSTRGGTGAFSAERAAERAAAAQEEHARSLAEVESKLAAQRTMVANLSGAQDRYAESLIRTDDAQRKTAASAEAAAEATVKIEKATRDYAAESQAALDSLAEMRADLLDDTLSEEDKLRATYRARLAAIKEYADAASGDLVVEAQAIELTEEAAKRLQRDLQALADEQQRVADTADAASRGELALAAAQRGVGIAQAGAEGSALAVASQMGPIGAIVAAVLGILEGLGKTGAAGVGERISELSENINQGLRELPALLAEALPDAVNESAGTFTEAFAEAAPHIVEGIGQGTFEVARYVLSEFPSILWDALKTLWEEIKSIFGGGDGNAGRNWLALLTGGTSEVIRGLGNIGRDRGATQIDRAGIYFLHQDEQIVQRNGRPTQSADGGAAAAPGSGISVTVHAAGVLSPQFGDALADFIREQQARGLVFG